MSKVGLKEKERIDDLEVNNLKIIQNTDNFCFGMDSVLISNYAKATKKDSIVYDLGTGTGIISILMAGKQEKVKKVYAIEIQKDMAEMAKRSVKLNDLDDKIEVVNSDLKGLDERKVADIVVSNPPYKKMGSGLQNETENKLISRHEYKCDLEDVIKAASKLLKDNGLFYMVHRPERFVDISVLMREYKLEPKEIRFVFSKEGEDAKLILIKGVKCGKPFLKIQKPLIIYDENGNYTDEIYKIYGKVKK